MHAFRKPNVVNVALTDVKPMQTHWQRVRPSQTSVHPVVNRAHGRLAALLGKSYIPIDATRGPIAPPREVAYVLEADCIGCTLCIQACPVDAIIGAAKRMHTVLETECTGCGLCIAPCPTDCIILRPPTWVDETPPVYWSAAQRDYFRQRDLRRRARRNGQLMQSIAGAASRADAAIDAPGLSAARGIDKAMLIATALARAKG